MRPYSTGRAVVAALLFALIAGSLPAQVVINEISASQSDRLLQRPVSGPPKLGCLPAWHELDFAVPSWWGSGAGPVGFGYTQTTNVQTAVRNKTPVVYLRRDFSLSAAQAASPQALELAIDYDDGFVAYLNGVEVARRNTGAAGSYAWHGQQAFNQKLAGTPETISLGTASGFLRAGANVLAIQVHNNSAADSRLFCSATLRLGGASPQDLVLPGDTWRWFAGTHEPSGGLYDGNDFGTPLTKGPDWTQLEYADAAWVLAPGALGFEASAGYGPQLGTNLTSMRGTAVSLYLRREFTLTQAQFDAITATSLTVDWDDGYVLYLNGYELSRANLPGASGSFVAYNQAATGHGARFENNVDNGAGVVASVTVPRNLLRVGRNVLSAQLHNERSDSSDLLLDVRFSATSGGSTLTFVTLGSQWRYRVGTLEFATPAAAAADVIAPEFLDWIELRNTGASPVDLGGWALTDDPATPMKWAFPAGTTIAAGGYLVVAASGRDVAAAAPGGLLHTNFSLSGAGEYLALRDAGGALRSELATVPDQDPFHTWGLDAGSGEYRFLGKGTPGAANVAGTAIDVASEVEFSQPTGFHPAGVTVALSTLTPGATIRYTLDGSEPTAASALYTGPFNPTQRPAQGPGTGTILREFFQWSGQMIPPPTFRASYANTTPTSSQLLQGFETPSGVSDFYTHRVRGYLHPPQSGNYQFWIATDDDGELWLSTNDNPASKQRVAYIQSNWASPREWTKHATQASVSIPLVAGQRYYIEALQSEGGGGDNCAVGWSGPGLPSGINVIEGRYLSPPETLPPNTAQPPGYGVVRARAFAPGRLPSETRARSYVVGLDARLATVPAIFLTGPGSETFYSPNGIFSQVGGGFSGGSWTVNNPLTDYNFCVVSGDAFERPAGVEIVNPGNVLVERTTAGVRFAGSPWSRPQYQLQGTEQNSWNSGHHNKPQMNLFFRGEFGISRFTRNGFFPTSPLKEWDEWRLRAGKNDAYNPFIIDEWMRRSFAAMGAPAPQGTFATVFVNGHFKSYFNPCERVRTSFFQDFYGSGNDWDINYIGSWEGGDGVAYAQMESFFRNNDFTSLANYNTGAAYWDMANVADYAIVNGWAATQDWPGNNYAFARERAAGAKWRFSMWDAEGALGVFGQSNQHNSFTSQLNINNPQVTIGSDGTTAALVFRRAHQNPEFRMLFADRLQKHFFNGGVMTRANMNARWNGMRAQVEPLVQAVFGGSFYNGHWDNWASRDAVFLQQARDIGLWPATLAPGMAPFGGTIGAGGSVTLSNPNGGGTLYYTTNGADPRAVGGTAQGTVYTAPIGVTSPLTVKARIRSAAGEWSPLVEAAFAPPPQRILITELHYNPPGQDDLTEFVELTNVSNQPAPLNGAHFTEGIGFTFGNVTLAPGQSIVLVKNSAAFTAAYPGVTVGGVFTGGLDNGGETLTLVDIAENPILTLTYGDANVSGWPAAADGDGATLMLRRQFSPATNPALGASWRASAGSGSPGAPDSTVFAGIASSDADGDGFTALMEYALGTSDANPTVRPALETSVDTFGRMTVSFLRPVAADDVIVEALESSDLSQWEPATLESETAEGSGAVRSTWKSNAIGARVFLRVRVRQQ